MTSPAEAFAPAHAGGGALAIQADGLVKTYPKGVRALDGLTFGVHPGTVFALLGPNGAGKSTTVKILTTLAQADAGTASVAGLDARARAAEVRHAIGVVAQRSGADPMDTGRENLLLSGRIQGLRGSGLTRRADDLLSRFALAGAAGRLVRPYSAGMRRRLAVALGLLHHPPVLFPHKPPAVPHPHPLPPHRRLRRAGGHLRRDAARAARRPRPQGLPPRREAGDGQPELRSFAPGIRHDQQADSEQRYRRQGRGGKSMP